MKAVALILCIAIVGALAGTLGFSEKAKLKEVHEKCQTNPATNVDVEYFRKIRAGEKPDPPANLGAHMLCISKGVGLQKEDGSLDKEVVREKVEAAAEHKDKVDEVVKECAVEKDTPEKTAQDMFRCFYKKHVHYNHE